MATTIAGGVTSAMRRALDATVVFVVSLMCAALVVAAVAPMSAMTDTPAHALMTGMSEANVAEFAAPAADAIDSDAALAMAAMCDRACVSKVTGPCTLALGLVVIMMMALLLAVRRDNFMGLLPRLRSLARPRRPRRERTFRTAMSLSSLCVLRV